MRHTDLYWLDPRWRADFTALDARLQELGLRVFETYRSDEAQLRVFNLGTSKARPGESPHQYGLACDWVPYSEAKGGWHWPKAKDPIWREMHAIVDQYVNLSSRAGPDIPWDSPHVEVTSWRALRDEGWRHKLRQRLG